MSDDGQTVLGDRYKLHRRLPDGGMSAVFVADDQLLGRQVAVKVLSAQFANQGRLVERFRREARAAASLNHPNIVSIYDWGEDGGTYYIVMEYVEGRSLAQLLSQKRRLSAAQIQRAAVDVATALQFAHEGGVVHRDVKPGNILVTPQGGMKVADFGIAMVLTANADDRLTHTDAVMGTATYISPEQAQGQTVDNRTDLYSLGVVLYELMTGEPPFTGGTQLSVALRHVQEPVAPLDDQAVAQQPAMAAVTMKLLSKDPDDRYPSAEALLADLSRIEHSPLVVTTRADTDDSVPTTGSAPTADLPTNRATAQLERAPKPTPLVGRSHGLSAMAVIVSLLLLAGCAVLLRNSLTGVERADDAAIVQTSLVEIPSTIGLAEQEARNSIEALNLVVQRRQLADDQAPQGQVLSTEPAAGTLLEPGQAVTLVVSSGPDSVLVSSVVTFGEEQALQTLKDQGFLVAIDRVTSSFAPEGEVISQTPGAGSDYELGKMVTIQVSAGDAELPVPNVLGTAFAAARDLLIGEGFDANSEYQLEFSDVAPKNTVIESDPAPGTLVREGATVSLVVSAGPRPLPTSTPVPTNTPVPEPPVGGVVLESLSLKGKELRIDLANNGDTARSLTALTISFPAGVTGNLEEIKQGKDRIYKPDEGVTSPASIGPGMWDSDSADREIGPGQTEEYKFKFDDDAEGESSAYVVTFTFDDGGTFTVAG